MNQLTKEYTQTEKGRENHRLAEARRRLKNPQKYIWTSAKRRAEKSGLEFTISESDIIIPETCPVLGITLVFGDGVNKLRKANDSPSLDRIDNSQGYTPNNIQVISNRANELKNNGTIAEFESILSYMKSHSKS